MPERKSAAPRVNDITLKFANVNGSGTASANQPGTNGLGLINQGYDETSNVNVVEELVNMIRGATWKWTQGTDGTVNAGENFRLRFRIDETASRAWTNKTWHLYYSTDDSTYNPLTGSTPVQFALSDNFTQGDDCTTQLTGGTGTFVTDNNGMCESAGATNSGTAGYLFEVEYCVKFIPSIATHNQVYYFKVYDGSSPITTYTDRPAITCSNGKMTPTDGITVGESKTVEVSGFSINVTALPTVKSKGRPF